MRALLVAAVAAGALLAGADEARACSCRVRSPSAYLADAAAAFRGAVVTLAHGSGGSAVALFEVDVVYKGEVPRAVTVRTGGEADTCAVPFRRDAVYVVFVTGGPDARLAHLCGGTTDDRTYIEREGIEPVATYGPARPGAEPSANDESVAARPDAAARSRAAPIALATIMALVAAMLLVRARNEAFSGPREPGA
ncbi:MAG TPA: hypothetical protein VM841_13965 [Actinomycetota bacterium]|nr:hypothetical protein [Actinomycetota bacterium]